MEHRPANPCRHGCWKGAWTLDDLACLARGTFAGHLGIRFVEIGPDWLAAAIGTRAGDVARVAA